MSAIEGRFTRNAIGHVYSLFLLLQVDRNGKV